MASAKQVRRFSRIPRPGQGTHLGFEDLLNMHQPQRNEGTNTLHLTVHVKRLIVISPQHRRGSQAFRFLASLFAFRNTTHEVAPFLDGGDDILGRTPSHHRSGSHFKFPLTLALSQPENSSDKKPTTKLTWKSAQKR